MSTAEAAAETDEVFDVATWLERANVRTTAPDYQPRHRADVPVDYEV